MRDFEYRRPRHLDEAIASLMEKGEGAFPFAGGTDILLRLKRRQVNASLLVDLKEIEDLGGIDRYEQGVRIGALTTLGELASSPVVRAEIPALARVAGAMAYPEIRNRGTIGGNICNADASADLVPPLIALESTVRLVGPAGEREMAVSDFIVGARQTAIRTGEILVEVIVPIQPSNSVCSFARYSTRRTGGVAAVSATALLVVANGLCQKARIVLGAIEGKPRIAAVASAFLEGKALGEEPVRKAAKMSVSGVSPLPDLRLSAQYRLKMAEVIAARALEEAWGEVISKCVTR